MIRTLSNLINKLLKFFKLRLVLSENYIFNHNNFELDNIKISKNYSMTGEKRNIF